MKKKMEKLTHPLFRPLTLRQAQRSLGATATTIYETGADGGDFHLDGDSHN
jgi:hypothetical protein